MEMENIKPKLYFKLKLALSVPMHVFNPCMIVLWNGLDINWSQILVCILVEADSSTSPLQHRFS